jgi:hypothetical protein
MDKAAKILKTAMDLQSLSGNQIERMITRKYSKHSLTASSLNPIINGDVANPGVKNVIALCDVMNVDINQVIEAIREDMHGP